MAERSPVCLAVGLSVQSVQSLRHLVEQLVRWMAAQSVRQLGGGEQSGRRLVVQSVRGLVAQRVRQHQFHT